MERNLKFAPFCLLLFCLLPFASCLLLFCLSLFCLLPLAFLPFAICPLPFASCFFALCPLPFAFLPFAFLPFASCFFASCPLLFHVATTTRVLFPARIVVVCAVASGSSDFGSLRKLPERQPAQPLLSGWPQWCAAIEHPARNGQTPAKARAGCAHYL